MQTATQSEDGIRRALSSDLLTSVRRRLERWALSVLVGSRRAGQSAEQKVSLGQIEKGLCPAACQNGPRQDRTRTGQNKLVSKRLLHE